MDKLSISSETESPKNHFVKVESLVNHDNGSSNSKEKGDCNHKEGDATIDHGSVLVEIKALVHADPEKVLRSPDEQGHWMLHRVCQDSKYNSNLDVVAWLIQEYPRAVKEADQEWNYPLHLACQSQASLPVIQLLTQEFPAAIKIGNKRWLLPFHVACMEQASDKVKAFLLRQYPKAALKSPLCVCGRPENDGNCSPLHFVCKEAMCSVSTVQTLLQCIPQAAQKKCSAVGMLPLHLACLFHSNEMDTIRSLLLAYPEGAGKFSEERRGMHAALPLHLALVENAATASVEVVELLLKAYPDAIRTRIQSEANMLPIHLAVTNNASLSVIQLLLKE